MAIQFHKMHAGGRSYTCDICHLRYWASAKELANNEIKVCEGCFHDGVIAQTVAVDLETKQYVLNGNTVHLTLWMDEENSGAYNIRRLSTYNGKRLMLDNYWGTRTAARDRLDLSTRERRQKTIRDLYNKERGD